MKRLLTLLAIVGMSVSAVWAGKWDTAARAARTTYLLVREPENAFSLLGFLIDLFLMCIPVAIVAGIVTLILKSVMDLDSEDAQATFFVIAAILLVICLLVYFLA